MFWQGKPSSAWSPLSINQPWGFNKSIQGAAQSRKTRPFLDFSDAHSPTPNALPGADLSISPAWPEGDEGDIMSSTASSLLPRGFTGIRSLNAYSLLVMYLYSLGLL